MLLAAGIRCLPAATVEPTHQDVSYSPHEKQKLNFWKIEADKPAPLLVHIQGGG